MPNDQPKPTTNFVCGRDGLVFRKGGGPVGVIERLPLNDGWHWRTNTMEHTGLAKTKKMALAMLINAWSVEDV